MEATSFPESNVALSKPEDMTADECDALSVLRCINNGFPVVISCWKLTQAELDLINKTGRVWLTVYGVTMPPVYLTVEKPFKLD